MNTGGTWTQEGSVCSCCVHCQATAAVVWGSQQHASRTLGARLGGASPPSSEPHPGTHVRWCLQPACKHPNHRHRQLTPRASPCPLDSHIHTHRHRQLHAMPGRTPTIGITTSPAQSWLTRRVRQGRSETKEPQARQCRMKKGEKARLCNNQSQPRGLGHQTSPGTRHHQWDYTVLQTAQPQLSGPNSRCDSGAGRGSTDSTNTDSKIPGSTFIDYLHRLST